jgi:hypothetical protein
MSLQERFEEYDRANPHVYSMFLRYAKMAFNKGFSKFSAKAIFERLRWYYKFETVDQEDFKLNNSYTAYYARKAMNENQELQGFFELRERRA